MFGNESITRHLSVLAFVGTALSAALMNAPGLSAQETGRTVQPGAPGEPGRVLSPGDTVAAARSAAGHSAADVHFIMGMIPHHAQALEMTRLVPDRTSRAEIVGLARRIERAQTEEIAMMERWLVENAGIPREEIAAHLEHHAHHAAGAGAAAHNGQGRGGGVGHPADQPGGHGQHHGAHGAGHGAAAAQHGQHGTAPAQAAAGDPQHPRMHGMLSPAEMMTLAAATGAEFDRLFLTFMIRHHEGALVMVEELFAAGGGHTADLFQLVSHIDSDQRIEIARMYGLLASP